MDPEREAVTVSMWSAALAVANYHSKQVQLALVKTPPMLEGWLWRKRKRVIEGKLET